MSKVKTEFMERPTESNLEGSYNIFMCSLICKRVLQDLHVNAWESDLNPFKIDTFKKKWLPIKEKAWQAKIDFKPEALLSN